jgi:glycerol-3-phosphate dehydrogenase
MTHVAPHLVRPLPFVIPLAAGTGRGMALSTMAGLRIGDGMRAGAGTRRSLLPPARRISALEARRLAPARAEDGLRGGLLSWDGQLEDDARLVIAVARTAAAHGARILTRVRVTRVDPDGADAVDETGGGTLRLRAGRVVLATGVWTGELTAAAALRPSQGSHLLVSAERLGSPRAAVNLPVPTQRGRWVFALPRTDGLVAIGLTDVPVDALSDEPCPTPAEETELLALASAALSVRLTADDVVGRYAGLRPLLAGEAGAESADLSRRHAVVDDPDTGALAVVGGKLTTYRAMAQDTVDRLTARPCRTARLPLVGAAPPAALRAVAAPERLVRRYGTEAPAVVALADGRPELLEPVAAGVPWCGAELLHALRHELVLGAGDLADRRTRAGLVPAWRDAVLEAASRLGEPALA